MQKEVIGSKGDIYTLEITENPFSIHCNCKAGSMGMLCKHTLNLLLSDAVSALLPKDIKIAYENYISTQQEVEIAKKASDKAKKKLGKLLRK